MSTENSGLDQGMPVNYSNAENEAIKHELVEWLEETRANRLEFERVGKWEADIMNYNHRRPLSTQQPFVASLERWQFCANKFIKAEPGSDESNKWYNEMLSNVALGTDYPCITSQSETIKICNDSEPTKARFTALGHVYDLTLADVWYGVRWWAFYLTVISVFIFLIVSVVS